MVDYLTAPLTTDESTSSGSMPASNASDAKRKRSSPPDEPFDVDMDEGENYRGGGGGSVGGGTGGAENGLPAHIFW